jgi:hypothetical protein
MHQEAFVVSKVRSRVIPPEAFAHAVPFAWCAAELESCVNHVGLEPQLVWHALREARVAAAEDRHWQDAALQLVVVTLKQPLAAFRRLCAAREQLVERILVPNLDAKWTVEW